MARRRLAPGSETWMMSVEAERAALCAPFDREIAHPQQGAGVERDRLTAFEDRGDDVRRKAAEPGRLEEDGDALLADDDARAKVAEERAERRDRKSGV